MHGTYSVTVALGIAKGVDFVKLKAPALTLRVGSPGFTLAADVQRLALTVEAESREAVVRAMGNRLQSTIRILTEVARNDESEAVRSAARAVLSQINSATAEGNAQDRLETPTNGSDGSQD